MPDSSYLDWPFLQADHRQLKTEIDLWCAANSELLDPDTSNLDNACRGLVKLLGNGGWLVHSVPETPTGADTKLDVRNLCLLREALAYHSGLADFCFAIQGLGSGPISLFGSQEQKQTWLPSVARGDAIAAFALSEKKAGSDVSAIATRAESIGDHYVLNGEKSWISNAGIADFYTVFARTGEAPGAGGLSAFVVAADTPGLNVSERIDIIAPHPLGTLEFENCKVPAGQLLGEAGQGFKVAMATLDVFRTNDPGIGCRHGAGYRYQCLACLPLGLGQRWRTGTCYPGSSDGQIACHRECAAGDRSCGAVIWRARCDIGANC